MADFASAGPNGLDPNILKPDITAPGLNILAAWCGAPSPTELEGDDRSVEYNIFSGISMSCPHVAATAALLKALNPSWSSASIRSALMTTALRENNHGQLITDARGNVATPFQYGSGHIQPVRALDPGLVYNTTYTDYLLFFCSGNGTKNIDSNFSCPENNYSSSSDLNYPSLAISNLKSNMTVRRRVTNVGGVPSLYNVTIQEPEGVSVEIFPSTLCFDTLGQEKSFDITLNVKDGTVRKSGDYFGWYSWSDGVHKVRSPMAISLG